LSCNRNVVVQHRVPNVTVGDMRRLTRDNEIKTYMLGLLPIIRAALEKVI
jgi:hypothetical protein